MNSDHLIIVEKPNDFRWSDPGMEVVTAENFLADGPEYEAGHERSLICVEATAT
ncbi:hypothetical protein CCAE64S_00890 [Castellaniella caeni]